MNLATRITPRLYSNNNTPAAGIVPYIRDNKNNVKFLLGRERSSRKWSGFVGGYETTDGTIINTAIREFNEETARIFEKDLDFVRDKIITGDNYLITDKNNNRLIYIWFIKFPDTIVDSPNIFLQHVNLMSDIHYKEKLSLKWFGVHDIQEHTNEILYKLKKSILDIHKKLP
jgi:8-oxo-dGTP pyrophosphatase MutT (NUDIX family)